MPSLADANKQTQVIRALERAGFERRSGGEHTIMAHPDGRHTAIPNHRQLKINTLRAILKQCGLWGAKYLELYAGKRI